MKTKDSHCVICWPNGCGHKEPEAPACICSDPTMFGHGENCPLSKTAKGAARIGLIRQHYEASSAELLKAYEIQNQMDLKIKQLEVRLTGSELELNLRTAEEEQASQMLANERAKSAALIEALERIPIREAREAIAKYKKS